MATTAVDNATSTHPATANSETNGTAETVAIATTTAAENSAGGARTPPVSATQSARKVPSPANPQPQMPTVNGTSKGSKPRPLKLPNQVGIPLLAGHGGAGLINYPVNNHFPYNAPQSGSTHFGGGSSYNNNESLSTDSLLDMMEQINRAVKASQFTPTLAGQIFRLYNQLKTSGESLEQSHRNELNRVFVSLRQACCRDSGQLGTPCRLKMMELVELRAMGWRPNLAHSQYYMARSTTSVTNGGSPDFHHAGDPMTGGEMEQLGAAPVSAPPFGAIPMNPFAFNIPTPMPSAADLMATNAGLGPASYYLIPAHVGHPGTGITFMAPPSSAGMMPPPQAMHHPVTATFSTPAVLTSMGHHMSNASPPMSFPRQAPGMMPKQPLGARLSARPTKVPGKNQFRDEVVIRNADSGKIMGVKGRRVALIEEISKTVISFQKVPQGAKERTLTVTGPSEESIIQAKILIEDTIRRNVSPVRADGQTGELLSHVDAGSDAGDGDDLFGENVYENGGNDSAVAELESILKQNCTDPAVLKVARDALNIYFQRHEQQQQRHEPLRRSATDAYSKQAHKERRKSMPLPILPNVAEVVEFENATAIVKTAEDLPNDPPIVGNPNANLKSKLSARSTPNLAAGERKNVLRPMASLRFADQESKTDVEDENRPSVCRIVYTRDFLLQCAATTISKSVQPALPTIDEQLTDILPEAKTPFDPINYKLKVAEFKQTRV